MPCPHFLKWGNQGVERQLGFLCVTFLHALVSSSVKWARGGGVRDYLDCGYDVFTKGLAVLDEATVGKWGGVSVGVAQLFHSCLVCHLRHGPWPQFPHLQNGDERNTCLRGSAQGG